MEKLLLFWISCGVSMEQQIFLSTCFSRSASQDRSKTPRLLSTFSLLILSKEIYPPD